MCAPNSPPNSQSRDSPSDNENEDWSDGSEEETGPTYTAEELAEIFLDFYTFLTTLHYDPADLKVAPPEGWPNIPDSYSQFKSDEAIEALRRLPYLTGGAAVHYVSWLVDFTQIEGGFFQREDWREKNIEFWSNEGEADVRHCVCIASGREGGMDLWLNAWDGEITENVSDSYQGSPEDVKDFFEDLKEAYRSLKLIPCWGRETIVAKSVPEREGEEVSEEEFRAQDKKTWWGSDLDVQYLRQIYRRHGWPNTFRREEAKAAVQDLMDSIKEERDEEWGNDNGRRPKD